MDDDEGVGFSAAGREPTADSAVADALVSLIDSVGRDVSEDSGRLMACLSDELGSGLRPRRAEVDAVVLAADEAVPALIVSRDTDDEAMARLVARGLAEPTARYAIAVWRYAIESTSLPAAPSLSPPEVDMEGGAERTAQPPPTRMPGSTYPTVLPPSATPAEQSATATTASQPTEPRPVSRVRVIGGTAVAGLLIAAVVVVAVAAGSGEQTVHAAMVGSHRTTAGAGVSTVVTPSSTTIPSTTTASTAVPVPTTVTPVTAAPPPSVPATMPTPAQRTTKPTAPRPAPTTPAPTTPAVVVTANNDSFTITPVAVSCSSGLCWGESPLNVLRNDDAPSNIKGGYVTLPQHGELRWDQANYQYTYIPNGNGPYSDSFVYEIHDDAGHSSRATVTIAVTCNSSFACN